MSIESTPTQPIPINSFPQRSCLFEDHIFNTKTKLWEPADQSNLRRCLHSKCTRRHKLTNRPVQVCKRENDCPDAGVTCFLLHDNTKLEPLCYWGKDCVDIECTGYRHPHGRATEICPNDEKCEEALISCFKLHTMSKLVPLCHYRADCINFICQKRHPPGRYQLCPAGSSCWHFIVHGATGCDLLHPKVMEKACRWSHCRAYGCSYIHHPKAPVDCIIGARCPNRPEVNDKGRVCVNKHPLSDRVVYAAYPDGNFN